MSAKVAVGHHTRAESLAGHLHLADWCRIGHASQLGVDASGHADETGQ